MTQQTTLMRGRCLEEIAALARCGVCASLAGMIAKHIFYGGRVQGVGFRYATKQLAAGFEVSGWVKNLPDGRVEMLVMSRDADELDAFLTELEENSGVSHGIKEKEVQTVPPPAGVIGFSIVR